MSKRAVDLSVAELSAMGAKAAKLAAQQARAAGQVVTGTVEVFEHGSRETALAQLLPSGTVTLVRKSTKPAARDSAPTRAAQDRSTD